MNTQEDAYILSDYLHMPGWMSRTFLSYPEIFHIFPESKALSTPS